jgi:hypothetical protein
MAGVRNIYENSLSLLFQLERLRMRGEFNRAGLLTVCRVDDPDSAAAKADINSFRRIVITNIIGIVFEV